MVFVRNSEVGFVLWVLRGMFWTVMELVNYRGKLWLCEDSCYDYWWSSLNWDEDVRDNGSEKWIIIYMYGKYNNFYYLCVRLQS